MICFCAKNIIDYFVFVFPCFQHIQMTYMNSDNQTYLVRYRDRLLVNRLLRCVRLCASHLPKQPILPTSLASSPPFVSSQLTSSIASKIPLTKTGSNLTTSTTTVSCSSPLGSQSTPNDQSILVDCVLGIFRFLVNVSHNGELLAPKCIALSHFFHFFALRIMHITLHFFKIMFLTSTPLNVYIVARIF